MPLRRRWVGPVAAVAAVAAIVLAVVASSLHGKLDRERTRNAQAAGALQIVAQPDARRIPVSGANGSLVVAKTGEAALVLRGLSPAPAGKTYETWVIESGKARAAGLFPGGGTVSLVGLTRGVPDGATVAVTVERKGGVDQPTGAPVISAKTA